MFANIYFFLFFAIEFTKAKSEELLKIKLIDKFCGNCLRRLSKFEWSRKKSKLSELETATKLNLGDSPSVKGDNALSALDASEENVKFKSRKSIFQKSKQSELWSPQQRDNESVFSPDTSLKETNLLFSQDMQDGESPIKNINKNWNYTPKTLDNQNVIKLHLATSNKEEQEAGNESSLTFLKNIPETFDESEIKNQFENDTMKGILYGELPSDLEKANSEKEEIGDFEELIDKNLEQNEKDKNKEIINQKTPGYAKPIGNVLSKRERIHLKLKEKAKESVFEDLSEDKKETESKKTQVLNEIKEDLEFQEDL